MSADPIFTVPIAPQTVWSPPNTPVLVQNSTKYPLTVEARVREKVIDVRIHEFGPNPLAQELADLKAVMGDLLQERVVGLKVYVVKWEPFEDGDTLEPFVHLSLASAQKWVARNRHDNPPQTQAPMWRSNSVVDVDGKPNLWMSGNYTITEHTLHLESP